MPLQSGTTLGPYAITAKIGEGGMGEVYRARDTKLDRDVALKVLPQAFTDDPDRLARFEREAKVLASLNHHNIGGIHGLEESEGVKALVLEYIEGPTLADRITQGAIPVDEALPIAKQIAEALEAAHEQGIIHRDLKPANIKLKPDGTVKVLDFGLAKAFQPDASDPNLSRSPTISLTAAATQMGMVIGTAAYMAPEQAKGKVVDKRADVWAFGAVLYEMLTGNRAFTGDDVSDTLAAVLRAEVNLTALPDDTSARLRQVLTACLQRDAKQRVHDIADVRLAMEGVFETPTSTTRVNATGSRGPMWHRPATVALLTAVATAAVGLGVWPFVRPEPSMEVMRVAIAPDEAAPLSYLGLEQDLAISRDGRVIVYKGPNQALTAPQLYLRAVDRFEAAPVRGAQGVMPFLSPDGEWVGFLDGNATLQKVSVLGGVPVTVAESPGRVAGATWGPDDQIVFGTVSDGLFRVPGAGGEPEALTTPDAESDPVHANPSFIAGRNVVLFTMSQGSPLRDGRFAALDLETREVTPIDLAGTSPRFVMTGHLVYATEDGSVRAVPFDPVSLEVRGTPVPVLEAVAVKVSGAANFDVSDGGRLVYGSVAGGVGLSRSLAWVDRQGQEEPINVPPRAYTYARLSPDGTRVALDTRDEENDIWIWDLARETLDRLTRDPGANRLPVWSPDGTRVAFTAERDGDENAYWQAADGSGVAQALTEDGGFRGPESFTPDGSRLLVITSASPPWDVGIVTIGEGGTVEPLLDGDYNESNSDVSPDGRWLAYQSDESGRSEVYVRPFPEVQAQRIVISTEGGTRPLWSRDGTELFYYLPPGRLFAVPVQLGDRFVAGRPEVVLEGEYVAFNSGRHYDVSLDGEHFLLLTNATEDDAEDARAATIMLVDNWFTELRRLVPID